MISKKNKQVETKLKKMLFDMGVGRDDTLTAKHKATNENNEITVFKCRSADDMMSVLNSINTEGLHDNK